MVEMGAEVIKVELAPGGDQTRGLPFLRNGRTSYYIQQNRGKKSVCINPKDPRAVDAIKRLVESCDVMVESFSPGAISRLGFGWDVVHALNPRLIMTSVSAFGQTGPLAKVPGFDYMAASYAGVISMIGEPDGAPYFYMLGIGDVMTGVHATAATCAALYHREKTSRGVQVEVSLLDSYFHCHEVNVACHSASDGAINPTRCGRHHWAVAPLGIYKCKEGYLFVAVLPAQWPGFCTGLGMPELTTDPRFVDNVARLENLDALTAIIEERLGRWTNAIEAATELGEHFHVPVAPVLSVAEAMRHPHLIEREVVRTVSDPVFGDVQLPGMPLRFAGYPRHQPFTAAYLGQHNVEVLTQYGGFSAAEVRALEGEGALITKPDLEAAPASASSSA
jgi:crotonobetainyl-CoA:carnitine CoA-transferase CaiB-like acyl-CoA transferase